MAKRDVKNSFAKRDEELAKSLSSAGKPSEELHVNNETAQDIVSKVISITKEDKKEKSDDVVIANVVELEQIKVQNKDVEIKTGSSDLFILKKKIKVRKKQKNLSIKEENAEILEAFANKNGFNECEVIDYLIENYLKLIKTK